MLRFGGNWRWRLLVGTALQSLGNDRTFMQTFRCSLWHSMTTFWLHLFGGRRSLITSELSLDNFAFILRSRLRLPPRRFTAALGGLLLTGDYSWSFQ